MSFKETHSLVHSSRTVDRISIKFFVVFPYYYLNVCKIYRNIYSLIPGIRNLCLLFPDEPLDPPLFSLIFSVVFTFSVSSIYGFFILFLFPLPTWEYQEASEEFRSNESTAPISGCSFC